MRKAILGGTGIYSAFEGARRVEVETSYGVVACDIAEREGIEYVFLSRHGRAHSVPPHRINHRANIMALKQLEVDAIYAICAVGSMNSMYPPGTVVLLRDFLECGHGAVQTFFDGEDGVVAHADMSTPYCPVLRARFLEAVPCAVKTRMHVHKQRFADRHTPASDAPCVPERGPVDYRGQAVYVQTSGPRFETATEIKAYRAMGGDVVGMTNASECALAKEAGICYAAVGVVTNWCTGVEFESAGVHDIQASMAQNKSELIALLIRLLAGPASEDEHCTCARALIKL